LIFIGVGANLASPQYGPPRATCGAALVALAEAGITIAQRSRWYRTAPVPLSAQPWFVNGVAQIKTDVSPLELLNILLETEARFGRRRGAENAPRVLDLDLLAFDDATIRSGVTMSVPHPRLHQRAFVLLPLRDLSPEWRHPVSGRAIADLIAALPAEQIAEPMADGPGVFGTEWQPPD
jgi:2-amino-4-hydroxy-6-hydroxymethyldihydropteridine diphosphokinase